MIKYDDRRYFTLNDVRHDMALYPTEEGPFVMEKNSARMTDFISSVMENCGWTLPSQYWTVPKYEDERGWFSNHIQRCWQHYIWPKFYDKAICYTDDDEIADNESYKVFANFVGPIISWMHASDHKFSLLIDNQEANRDKLLGQIKSSSVSRFNDTPQNQGEFEDNSHNTNVTKTENATDGTTLLARLNEIENNLKRLYEDWSNEFRKFIIWSAAENE